MHQHSAPARSSWPVYHRRADVLRAVSAEADLRRDGALPTHVAGVSETFSDELDLVSALQLRWHTRLAGAVERALVAQPADLEAAVRRAWATTVRELPGIRAVLDRCVESPSSAQMARALAKAVAKERVFLAMMAGLASGPGVEAEAVGREIQHTAALSSGAEESGAGPGEARVVRGSADFVARIKAVLATV